MTNCAFSLIKYFGQIVRFLVSKIIQDTCVPNQVFTVHKRSVAPCVLGAKSKPNQIFTVHEWIYPAGLLFHVCVEAKVNQTKHLQKPNQIFKLIHAAGIMFHVLGEAKYTKPNICINRTKYSNRFMLQVCCSTCTKRQSKPNQTFAETKPNFKWIHAAGLLFHVCGEAVVNVNSARADRQTDKENYIDFRLRLLGEPGSDRHKNSDRRTSWVVTDIRTLTDRLAG